MSGSSILGPFSVKKSIKNRCENRCRKNMIFLQKSTQKGSQNKSQNRLIFNIFAKGWFCENDVCISLKNCSFSWSLVNEIDLSAGSNNNKKKGKKRGAACWPPRVGSAASTAAAASGQRATHVGISPRPSSIIHLAWARHETG